MIAVVTHRLPGMSISRDQWDALTERAEALGITRTELIRQAITRTIADEAEPEVISELVAARRQLAAIKAALNEIKRTVAA